MQQDSVEPLNDKWNEKLRTLAGVVTGQFVCRHLSNTTDHGPTCYYNHHYYITIIIIIIIIKPSTRNRCRCKRIQLFLRICPYRSLSVCICRLSSACHIRAPA